jgi:hypothetical protein
MIDQYTFTQKEVLKARIKKVISLFRGNKSMLNMGGKFDTWESALKVCSGYDSDVIFDKVKKAAIAVRDGKACFERDSYLFYKKQTNFPILAILLSIYIEMGELRVLDFGGSLGSMYFQHKDVLGSLGDKMSWTIVEQKHFVEFGKRELCDGILNFEYEIQDVEFCNCIIFGGSLQYIKNYKQYLSEALQRKCKYIILDKVPVSNQDWISIERVHEPIYEGSYPFYVFDKKNTIGGGGYGMFRDYDLVEQWIQEMGTEFMVGNRKAIFESFLFKTNDNIGEGDRK